jgi:hypothetical protein
MIEVVLHIFTNRSDPKWNLNATQILQLKKQLSLCKVLDFPNLVVAPESESGYRGFTINNWEKDPELPLKIIIKDGIEAHSPDVLFEDTQKIEQWFLQEAREKGYDNLVVDHTL